MFVGFSKKVLVYLGSTKFLYFIGLGIPFLFNVLEVLNIMPTRYDLTPITFNLTFLIFGYLAYKYQFLDVRSLARYDVYEHMQEGIIVFDHNLQVESINSIVFKTIPITVNLYENMTIEDYLEALKHVVTDEEETRKTLMDFLHSDHIEMEMELGIIKDDVVRHYMLNVQKAELGKGKVIIRVLGIDRYKKAIEKLEDQNMTLQKINSSLSEELSVRKKLALAKERNRISKEVHDIMGHSLTVVLSLIEASKIVLVDEKPIAREKLEMAMTTARYNLNNLKKSLSNPHDMEMTGEKLIDDIKIMASSIEKTGTTVDLITRGSSMPMPSHYFDAVYHICQEGLTNAIRHGRAKLITIALRFDESQVDIMIVDNGLGADYFEKGNGLKHMENRISELSGYFTCGSPDGEGFSVHINLPLY
jgi:signal transduction histidine kinase